MKTSALSLVVAISSALALTACGGGGSSGGSTAQLSTPVIQPNTGNNGSTTGNTNPNTKTQISGETIEIDGSDTTDEIRNVVLASTDINKLKVNGRTFEIGSPDVISGSFSINKTEKLESSISGTHMKYAKYGVLWDNQDEKDYMFYQGEKTPVANIPTTSTAMYTGGSLYVCSSANCGDNDDMTQGTSRFNVDFGKKTLTGSISNTKASDVALNATISGNTFSGTNDVGTETRGAFFGDKAQEISGTYLNKNQGFGGVFGATKQ